jgi:hypothetical protein
MKMEKKNLTETTERPLLHKSQFKKIIRNSKQFSIYAL